VAGDDVPSATDRLAPVLDADGRGRAAGGVIVAGEPSAGEPSAGEFIDSELLVEEISIDGMCGVY
jgi:mycofactocin precursor